MGCGQQLTAYRNEMAISVILSGESVVEVAIVMSATFNIPAESFSARCPALRHAGHLEVELSRRSDIRSCIIHKQYHIMRVGVQQDLRFHMKYCIDVKIVEIDTSNLGRAYCGWIDGIKTVCEDRGQSCRVYYAFKP